MYNCNFVSTYSVDTKLQSYIHCFGKNFGKCLELKLRFAQSTPNAQVNLFQYLTYTLAFDCANRLTDHGLYHLSACTDNIQSMNFFI